MIAAARAALSLGLVCLTAAAGAATATIEASSDERRRGLSWSEGRATARAAVSVAPSPAFRLDAAATTLRGAARHGGADAGFDLGASWQGQAGAIRFDAGAIGHLFAGGTGTLDYGEAQAGIGTTIGPVAVDLSASYAPRQQAIGGDNLYLAAGARVAIVGTPFTVLGAVGRSTGDVRNEVRSTRLRPDGHYVDWRIGVEHVRGPLSASLVYVGTDIDASGVHARDTVLLRIGLTL